LIALNADLSLPPRSRPPAALYPGLRRCAAIIPRHKTLPSERERVYAVLTKPSSTQMDTAEQPFLLLVVEAPAKIGPVLEVLSRAGYKARAAESRDLETLTLLESGKDVSQQSLEAVERKHILSVLKRTHGVIEGPRGAAVLLKLKPSTTRFRMKKLGIAKTDYQFKDDAHI
jgi:transcriptional regulator with GAF, ATPase, and Fis domain